MYTNTGYMDLKEDELENNKIPLRVNSCGVYRLVSLPVMSTFRPQGRSDYQLLYIAAGKAFFTIDGATTEVSEGSMILYPPHTPQQYSYYINDKPEVYWVHFTGSEADSLSKEAGFLASRILYTGISSRYQELFLSIIREIQLTRPSFGELSALYLKQLFLLLKRIREEGGVKRTELQKQMEKTVRYFHENLAKNIEIETYAKEHHMSTCWFIRSFKEYAGMPPGKYLTEIRIKKAKELLESTDYSIGEIGGIIGYENPLYFSRIFKKTAGVSPAEYRKAAR